VVVPTRYRSILETAAATAGAEVTRQQMIGMLIAAGYSRNSAVGRMSSSHPLFERTGSDRYRIVGSHRQDHVDAASGSQVQVKCAMSAA
jgi:hypothetical protein